MAVCAWDLYELELGVASGVHGVDGVSSGVDGVGSGVDADKWKDIAMGIMSQLYGERGVMMVRMHGTVDGADESEWDGGLGLARRVLMALKRKNE